MSRNYVQHFGVHLIDVCWAVPGRWERRLHALCLYRKLNCFTGQCKGIQRSPGSGTQNGVLIQGLESNYCFCWVAHQFVFCSFNKKGYQAIEIAYGQAGGHTCIRPGNGIAVFPRYEQEVLGKNGCMPAGSFDLTHDDNLVMGAMYPCFGSIGPVRVKTLCVLRTVQIWCFTVVPYRTACMSSFTFS